MCCQRRLFARFRSLQLLTVATDRCPAWIYACVCLHNLLEESAEPFDPELLEVEDVFPVAALDRDAQPEEQADDAMDEADDLPPAAPAAAAAEIPSARRDRVAKELWNTRFPENRIA